MGREIRMVPEGWEHPVDSAGEHIPMFDCSWEQWKKDREAEDIEVEPEHRRYCVPDSFFDKPRDHFQVYENVTEGTPLSPVFATEEELVTWLVKDGGYDGPRSEEAARHFVKKKYAFSMMVGGGSVAVGAEVTERMATREREMENDEKEPA